VLCRACFQKKNGAQRQPSPDAKPEPS
jgi:hypothetical protein